jgi:GAF domain
MGRLGAVRQKRNPQATELSQLKVELRRVSEKLESREGELAEALEQQSATSEILRVIASSPTDIQPVLDAVIESAARLCDAADGLIARIDGDLLLPAVAKYGSMPVPEARRLSYGTPVGRAIIERKTVHVHDLKSEVEIEFPHSKPRQAISGVRTMLATPLLPKGRAFGAIVIRREEVRPFSDKQIELLRTSSAMRSSLHRLKEGLRSLRRETVRNGLRFPSMIVVQGFRQRSVRRYFKNFIRSRRTEDRNPKERALASLSPKRLWSCMVEKFGLNPRRVAGARSRSLCRYQVRNTYPHPCPLPERARAKRTGLDDSRRSS